MKPIKYFKETFFLEKYEQKAKLIELLIIIGALIFAFKIPEEINWIFLIFIGFSVPYFIIIQKEEEEDGIKEHVELINFLSIIVSVSFSSILAYSMAVAGTNNISILSLKIGSFGVTYIIYGLFFTVVIWSALRVKIKKKTDENIRKS